MNAYETRVSLAFRSVEGGADPLEDLEGTPIAPVLSEAQLDTFWAGIVASLDAARRTARQIVPRQNVDDVVHSAAVLYVEALQRQSSRFPESEDALRAFFLTTVKHHARDCVRQRVVDRRPVHSHWSEAPEPRVNGSTTPDRALDQVFARNDQRKYDAPAPVPRRPVDDLDNLYNILRSHIDELTPAQREIIDETFFEGRTRAQIVKRRGISASTYDNHLQAAYRSLRTGMMEVVEISADFDRPYWYDLVEILNGRHTARQLRRQSRKKGKRFTSQHERSTFKGEASTDPPERGKIARERVASAASGSKS